MYEEFHGIIKYSTVVVKENQYYLQYIYVQDLQNPIMMQAKNFT